MSLPTCLVLMCTYNGERFLREQIESILSQEGVAVSIRIADDCSSDSTVKILDEYAVKYPNISYSVNTSNKNFTYNFIDLLFSVKDTSFDYYAFSDQDDIWMPDKLQRAIRMIGEKGQQHDGTLYCSNLYVADIQGRPVGLEEDESIRKTNRCTYLYENICTGCTMVFDKRFMEQCVKYYPQGIRLHDHWFFLIAVYTAAWIYDSDSRILYRQHIDNQVGSKSNIDSSLSAQFSRFVRKKGGAETVQRLQQLLEGYGEEISEADKKNIRIVANYRKKLSCRLKFTFGRRFKRRKNDIRFRIRVLFGKV